jgi:hypothetical protein
VFRWQPCSGDMELCVCYDFFSRFFCQCVYWWNVDVLGICPVGEWGRTFAGPLMWLSGCHRFCSVWLAVCGCGVDVDV